MVLSATAVFGCEDFVKIARIGRQVGRPVECSCEVGDEIQAGRALLPRTARTQPLLQKVAHDVRFADTSGRGFRLQLAQQRGWHL